MKFSIILSATLAICAFAQEFPYRALPKNAVPLQGVESREAGKSGERQTVGGEGYSAGAYTYQSVFTYGTKNGEIWYPVLQLTNSGTENLDVLVEFFDAEGQPMALPFQNSNGSLTGRYPLSRGTIGPKALGVPELLMSTTEPLRTGWARVTANNPNALTASTWQIIGTRSSIDIVTFPSAKAQSGKRSMIAQNTVDGRTYLNILNPTADTVSIQFTAYDSNGKKLCSKTSTLESGRLFTGTPGDAVGCVRRDAGDFVLEIDSNEDAIALHAYHDFSDIGRSTAPIHLIGVDEQVLGDAAALPSGDATVPLTGAQCDPIVLVNGVRASSVSLPAAAGEYTFSLQFPKAPLDRLNECVWKTDLRYVGSSPRFVDGWAPREGSGERAITVNVSKNDDKNLSRSAMIYVYMLNDSRNATQFSYPRASFQVVQKADR